MIPGSLAFPLVSLIYATKEILPPAIAISLASSGDYFAISLTQVAAFFLT